MEVTQVQPDVATTSTSNSNSQISSDFETFLKMLTAQIENQDPLNPIESSDYAVQLATFSSVEQQVQTNDLLRALSDQFGTSSIAQLADWVGKEARTAAPVAFDGTAVTLHPTIKTGAEHAVLVVRNSSGDEVGQSEIPTDGQPVSWAGVTSDGFPYPAGIYTFDVQSYSGEDFLGSALAETYQTVTEIRRDPQGNSVVVLGGETEVESEAVTALRAAD